MRDFSVFLNREIHSEELTDILCYILRYAIKAVVEETNYVFVSD